MKAKTGFIRRKFFLLALAEIRRDIEGEINGGGFDRRLSGNLDSVLNLHERYGSDPSGEDLALPDGPSQAGGKNERDT